MGPRNTAVVAPAARGEEPSAVRSGTLQVDFHRREQGETVFRLLQSFRFMILRWEDLAVRLSIVVAREESFSFFFARQGKLGT